MAMEENLVSRLVALGTTAGSRVSWFGRQRGDALPAIQLTKVYPGRDWTMAEPDNLDRPRVQIDCWAASAGAAATLARAVRSGMESSATVSTTLFHPAMLDGEGWDEEESPDGGARLFRVRMDFQFYHEET